MQSADGTGALQHRLSKLFSHLLFLHSNRHLLQEEFVTEIFFVNDLGAAKTRRKSERESDVWNEIGHG